MNTRHLVAAAAAAVAFVGGAAQAQEATNFEIPPSTLSRAEVKADLARAQADLAIPLDVRETVQPASAAASRAEVQANAAPAEQLDLQDYVGG